MGALCSALQDILITLTQQLNEGVDVAANSSEWSRNDPSTMWSGKSDIILFFCQPVSASLAHNSLSALCIPEDANRHDRPAAVALLQGRKRRSVGTCTHRVAMTKNSRESIDSSTSSSSSSSLRPSRTNIIDIYPRQRSQ